MRFQLALLLFAAVISKCNEPNDHGDQNLNIPDSVPAPVKGKQAELYGTHIFMLTPNGFSFNVATNRLQKDDSTYIKVIETQSASYKSRYDQLLQLIRQEKANGFQTFYQKEFIFQGNNAIILYGLDKSDGTAQIILLFGSDTGSVIILSRFRANDVEARRDIVKSLLNCYQADSTKIDVTGVQ